MTSQIVRPWSALEVEVKMAQVIEELDDAVAVQKALSEAYAGAEHEYKMRQAMSWLQSRQDANLKSDKLREAWVYTQVGELRLKRDIALGQLDAQKNLIRSLSAQADTLRSLARSSRDVTDGPGFGGQPQR